jgi:DNA-binding PadR family transcriptional regulator
MDWCFYLMIELKPSIQERSIRAFLDLAILSLLITRPITGYEVTAMFVKKYGILVGPSAIYSKLVVMERKGWIKPDQNKSARSHYLTEEGKRVLKNIDNLTADIQKFVKKLLNQSGTIK